MFMAGMKIPKAENADIRSSILTDKIDNSWKT